jgi:hypothetical protein
MSRLRKHLLVLVGMFAVVVGTATAPASAAPSAPAAPASATESTSAAWPKVTRTTIGSATGTMSVAAACPVTVYGYRGTLLCGATAMEIEWSPGRLEFFGIATDRSIWHVWPNGGGWKVMPGNGHADDIYDGWWEGSARRIFVHVNSNDSYWYSDDAGPGWNGWHRW